MLIDAIETLPEYFLFVYAFTLTLILLRSRRLNKWDIRRAICGHSERIPQRYQDFTPHVLDQAFFQIAKKRNHHRLAILEALGHTIFVMSIFLISGYLLTDPLPHFLLMLIVLMPLTVARFTISSLFERLYARTQLNPILEQSIKERSEECSMT